MKCCVWLLEVIRDLGGNTNVLLKGSMIPPRVKSEFNRLRCVLGKLNGFSLYLKDYYHGYYYPVLYAPGTAADE